MEIIGFWPLTGNEPENGLFLMSESGP